MTPSQEQSLMLNIWKDCVLSQEFLPEWERLVEIYEAQNALNLHTIIFSGRESHFSPNRNDFRKLAQFLRDDTSSTPHDGAAFWIAMDKTFPEFEILKKMEDVLAENDYLRAA